MDKQLKAARIPLTMGVVATGIIPSPSSRQARASRATSRGRGSLLSTPTPSGSGQSC